MAQTVSQISKLGVVTLHHTSTMGSRKYTHTPAAEEVILVRDYRIERAVFQPQYIGYTGWRGLRAHFRAVRVALAFETLGGTVPAPGTIIEEKLRQIVLRNDDENADLRRKRRNARGSSFVDTPRERLFRLRHSACAALSQLTAVSWESGRRRAEDEYVLPQGWVRDFPHGFLRATAIPRSGEFPTILLRKHGQRALGIDASRRLWVGDLQARHRTMVLKNAEEGTWTSLLTDPP